MKKRILFILPDFNHGGTNRALESLLPLLDDSRYDISVMSLVEDGYYKTVFSKYNIVRISSFFLGNNFFRRWTFRFDKYLHIDFVTPLYKIETKRNSTYQDFDTIIAFQEGGPTKFASSLHVNAKKVSWLHCDYNLYKEVYPNAYKKEHKVYQQFDDIVCVSKYTAETFRQNFPDIKARVHGIYNTLNIDYINSQSDFEISDMPTGDNVFNIVSIGRLDPVKQFHLIPSIIAKIKEQNIGKELHWYIIGPTSRYETVIRKEIKKYSVEDNVTLLGGRDNPYPYIKQSQLLVSLSRSEACPYVVNEAKILHTPVLANNYPTAVELVDENTGIITPVKDMHETIINLLKYNCEEYKFLKGKCQNSTYTNDEIIREINKIL